MRQARTAVSETTEGKKQLLVVTGDISAVPNAKNRGAADICDQSVLRDCEGTINSTEEEGTTEDDKQSPLVVGVRQFTADGHDASSNNLDCCRDGDHSGGSVEAPREDSDTLHSSGRALRNRGGGDNLGESAFARDFGDGAGSLVEGSGLVSDRRVYSANYDAENSGEIGGSGATCAGFTMEDGKDVRDYSNRNCGRIRENGAFCADSTLDGGGNVSDHDEGVSGVGESGVIFADSSIEGGMDMHCHNSGARSRGRFGEDGKQRGTSPLDTFVVEFESAIRGVDGLDTSSRRRLVEVVRSV